MEHISSGGNLFTGSIPSQSNQLVNLSVLNIARSLMTGSTPSEMGLIKSK
jgi:hypothetical protein